MNKRWIFVAILLFGLFYIYYEWSHTPRDDTAALEGDRLILDAFDRQRSGIMVESAGTVVRILGDDLEGSRHQRFIIRLESDHTLLVSHNIDIARRIPLSERDEIGFRGMYEWNDRGGVLHWTHRDPDGRRPGGWIRHRGKIYD